MDTDHANKECFFFSKMVFNIIKDRSFLIHNVSMSTEKWLGRFYNAKTILTKPSESFHRRFIPCKMGF